MQADYSVELGREDPALELPWQSEDGRTRYYDLKRHPESITQIAEAADAPELKTFLTRINAPAFPLQTAKCDTWSSREISPEEEIFGAPVKFVSYVDLVFVLLSVENEPRLSFERHEALAKSLCALLERAPEMSASFELVIRRCYYHSDGRPDESASGFCMTIYVSGFGNDEAEARQRWSIALALVQHALVQVLQQ
jgi:hypothetical protein